MGDYWSNKKVNIWWIAFIGTIIGVCALGYLLDLNAYIVALGIGGTIILFLVIRKQH